MGLAPLLAFAFQADLFRRTVVNPDPEFLPGIRSVFIFFQTPVIIIVKIQAADTIGSGLRHMTVQRQQMGNPVPQQLNLAICYLVFQFMAVFSLCAFTSRSLFLPHLQVKQCIYTAHCVSPSSSSRFFS